MAITRIGSMLVITAGVCATVALTGSRSGSLPAENKTAKPAARRITFAHDIAPIMFANCTQCHRDGQVAPFPLQTYADASKRAKQLATVVQSKYMPPWHADSHGEFLDEHVLKPEQVALFKQWADEGAPEGNRKEMPAAPVYPAGWSYGKPDLIVQPDREYKMAAEGGDVYRCFVIPTGISQDTYIQALEVRPGNSKVVHHVIAYLDGSGQARKLQEDNKDGQPGYAARGGLGILPTGALGGWAPGNMPHMLPEGIGARLKKGEDIVLQVHYHADGKLEPDQTKIGLYFNKKPVDKRVRILPVFAPVSIPAGTADYWTKGQSIFPMPNDAKVLEVTPHMHLLGKEMTVTAKLPNATDKTLVRVPNWDFNWQTNYMYKEPMALPRGTVLNLAARYDNSTGNPNNPSNPPRYVGWGEQTTDEMCIAFVWYVLDEEHITQGKPVMDLLDMIGGLGRQGGGGGRRLRRQPAS